MTNQNSLNDRYILGKILGRGGFANVYLATDKLLKRKVAIKILNDELNGNYFFLERFKVEAQFVAALDHPNILPIYDFGQVEHFAYLVMPYIEGGTLEEVLKKHGNLEVTKAISYLKQAAEALDYAHSQRIVHRDLKPLNFLLRKNGETLLVSDFGISKIIGDDTTNTLTRAIGTPAYMAPEQIKGKVSLSVDIYALGCIAFRLLTGHQVYPGNQAQIYHAHLNSPIPSIEQISKGKLSSNLQPVFDKVLAKDPGSRYIKATDFVKELTAVLFNNTFLGQTPNNGFDNTVSAIPEKTINAEVDSHLRKASHPSKILFEALEGVEPGQISIPFDQGTIEVGIKKPKSDKLYFWNEENEWHFKAKQPDLIQSVSRNHAYFKINSDGEILIYTGNIDNNRDAVNGTFINGIRLQIGQGQILNNNDLIGFGPRNKPPNSYLARPSGVTIRFRKS